MSATPADFHHADRWSALGDSITHTGSYHTWIRLYYVTRFPGVELQFTNCGIAGDTAAGAVRRAGWDILPNRPTVATVLFGMNDVNRSLYGSPETEGSSDTNTLGLRRGALETFRTNMHALCTALSRSGSRLILLTPSLYDDTARLDAPTQTGVNDALAACADIVRALGAEFGAPVIDFHGPMSAMNRIYQQTDASFTLTGADRIHPEARGHFVMAYLFLKAQGAARDVARASIDAISKAATTSAGGSVRHIAATESGLSFQWTAEALPYPIDRSVEPALRWIPFVAEFNREILQVTSLPAGRYSVKIDGRPIAIYTAGELEHGVNLAEQRSTPQYEQATAVLWMIKEQAVLEAQTLRNIALVEHQCVPPDLQPVTLETSAPFHQERLDRLIRQRPRPDNLLRIYRLYPVEKPRQEMLLRERVRFAELARQFARPRPHTYAIERIGP